MVDCVMLQLFILLVLANGVLFVYTCYLANMYQMYRKDKSPNPFGVQGLSQIYEKIKDFFQKFSS